MLIILNDVASKPDCDKIKKMMNSPIVFDGTNLFDTKEMNVLGFVHSGIGTK
jgi:hypothetical protein